MLFSQIPHFREIVTKPVAAASRHVATALLCSPPALASLRLSNAFLISPSPHPHLLKEKKKKKKRRWLIQPQNQKQENKEQNREGDGGHSEPRGERSWRSVGSTVLSIGKRAAIAGAAVTSAPAVVPPALIFSAVGLAFAVPFGILFAGVACTDKVMRSLLSQPAAGAQAEEPEGEADVEGGGGEEERELILSSCYESAADELLSDGGDDKFVPTTKLCVWWPCEAIVGFIEGSAVVSYTTWLSWRCFEARFLERKAPFK